MNKKRLLALVFWCIFHCYNGYAINCDKIMKIESNGNPSAYNSKSGAIGLFQITKVCLDEYNHFHKIKYTRQDLFNREVNIKVGLWYLEDRIPEMLKHYGKEVNDRNIIWCYNSGVGNLLKNIMPKETIDYIRKYNATN